MEYNTNIVEKVLAEFKSTVTAELEQVGHRMNATSLSDAVKLILECESAGGRIHLTGIGKPHHIAQYLASLFSSTGTPAYLLDGTEATHGSSGQVLPGDVVIAISYYGDVAELNNTMLTLKANGAKIIGLTGFNDSLIATLSDIHINCFVSREGDALNRAPRTSMLVTLYTGMMLSLALQEIKGLSLEQYLRFHPSGKLGQEIV